MKFSIRQIRDAYQQAAADLDRYYQLTPAIKLRMCELLKCNPCDLEAWIGRATDQQFEAAIF